MDKSLITILIVLGISTLALFNLDSTTTAPYSFEQFKADYGKKYRDDGEEQYRRTIFLRNLIKFEEHNANPLNTHKVGVNQFTDLLDEEFRAIYLTLQVPKRSYNILAEDLEISTPIVKAVDWTSQITPVKNQGSCGSCWAFSAIASIEANQVIKNGVDKNAINLSEQELVDCSRPQGNQGCNGGWMDSAFDYIKINGIHETASYPYVARDQTCKASTATGPVWKITGYVDVAGCDKLLNALNSNPVSVAVDASVWSSYRSGVLSSCGKNVNHGVLAIAHDGTNWKIKNSWGASWGESGFIRLAGGDTCAVCHYHYYATV
jgi:C1A family cysteine protease